MGNFSGRPIEYSETIGVCVVEGSSCVVLKNDAQKRRIRVFGPGTSTKDKDVGQLAIINIGHLFDVIEIVRFQQNFIRAAESNENAEKSGFGQKTQDPKVYFSRVFNTMRGDHKPIVSVIQQLLFREQNPLVKPADLSYLRYKNMGFAPYFPIPSMVLEEQRTRLWDTSDPLVKGKTENEDDRAILPITTDLPQPKNYRDVWELLHDYLRNHGDRKVRILYEDMQKTYAGVAQRLCCFAFRGDHTRHPEAILDAGGMLANTTRKDPWGAADAAPVDSLLKQTAEKYLLGMQKEFLNLQLFLGAQRGKAFISTTKSTAIAKCFTTYTDTSAPCKYHTKWGQDGGTRAYCYVVKVIGGFEIQSFDDVKKPVAKLPSYSEQEITQLGAIWKENIFGFRRVWTTPRGQFFSGPIFLRNDFEKRYPNAFREILELLSGKSQGQGGNYSDKKGLYPDAEKIQNCYRPNFRDIEALNQGQDTFDRTEWDEGFWPFTS